MANICVIDVDVRVLPSLGELSGVLMETPADLDVFIYDSATSVWEPRQLVHGEDLASMEEPLDHPMYQRKHGFELDAAGVALQTITYDKTTRVVTVTPTGASFSFWIDGVKFTKTGAQAAPAHAASTGKHFVYYDADGDLQVSTTPWAIRDRTVTPVALVYYYTGLSDGLCFYECHTADRHLEQHYHDHFTQGTQFISGAALTGYTLTTDSSAGVTFAIAATTIADEDIVRALTAVADGGPYMTLWRTGAAGDWTFNDTRTLPWEYDVGANYVAYNNPDAGGAGVWGLTSAGGGDFVPYFLCCSTGVQANRQFFLVPPQAAHGTFAQAQAYTISSLAWGTLPFEEFVPLYRIIYRTGASYGTSGRGRIEQIDAIATLPGAPASHNSLSGRDAADAHPASAITFTPYVGTTLDLAATTVQAAIEEIADEVSGVGVAALDDVPDVNAATPGDGDVLTWDNANSEWIASPPTGGASALDDLTDVNAPSPNNGDVLAWDNANGWWEPVAAGTPGAHATSHQDGGGDEIDVTGLSGLLADAQKVAVHKNGTLVGTRKNINLIEGSNVTLTVTDDSGDDEVDVTIASTGGSGGDSDVQSFTAPGADSWTKPTSFTPNFVLVKLWAGGGGGGGGGTASGISKRYGGAGGGGGAYSERLFLASDLGSMEDLVVGDGGTGGSGGTSGVSGDSGGIGGASTFGTTTPKAYAGGGGGGRGAGSGGGTTYYGGGGGGTHGPGATGTSTSNSGVGGVPQPFPNSGYGCSGGGGGNSGASGAASRGGNAECGGAGGGTTNNSNVANAGGCSVRGGGGGGGGGSVTATPAVAAAAPGGSAGVFPYAVDNGGAAGTGGAAGDDGADGADDYAGGGGGGGGSTITADTAGGAGGAGGDRGGGGGGGGAGTLTGAGGAGGNGGRGEIIVISW